jgi:chorismate mutase / prephenate dehydratase
MSTQDTRSNNPDLLAFRKQIDDLDDQIIALFRERINIIARVGEWKRKNHPGECPIRSGREAAMVRRVMEKFSGSLFNPVAAAAMWRILIGSSVCIESALSLSVYAPDKDDMFFWLAREYFGPTLPVTRQPHVNRVIGDVKDGKASIGIVPTLQNDDTSNWWSSLLANDAPKIFARIPFVSDGVPGKYHAALAIAHIQPEDSGNDVSLIVLDADHNTSQNRLQSTFAKENLAARWISITSPDPSTRRHLIELKGFVTAEDAAMKAFLDDFGGAPLRIIYLGSYALPIVVKSTETVPSYAARATQA